MSQINFLVINKTKFQFPLKYNPVCVLDICRVFLYTNLMKLKRAFQLKQLKIHKKLNDYLKKYTEDKKVYSDLVKLRELIDEQDKLLDIE